MWLFTGCYNALDIMNRQFRILLGWFCVLAFWFVVFFGLNFIPTKISYEYKPELPPMFKRLAEYKSYTSYFKAIDNNLVRIDVLFKNQALESREELKVQIFDDRENVIFEQNYDHNNFGDTNRVRMDFPAILNSKDRQFRVLITPIKIVDWKLFFGVKGDDIDLISYYSTGLSATNSLQESIKLLSSPILFLPLILVTIFLW